jgi:preprotein translocase SecE subunit
MEQQLEPQVAGGSAGKIAGVRDFFVTTRLEMDKVSWPPRPELMKATKWVLIGALGLGVVIGLLDFVLKLILVDGVGMLAAR